MLELRGLAGLAFPPALGFRGRRKLCATIGAKESAILHVAPHLARAGIIPGMRQGPLGAKRRGSGVASHLSPPICSTRWRRLRVSVSALTTAHADQAPR